jgi:taurine--2-oxoglutarate transaminase
MGVLMAEHHARLAAKHPSVGRTRSLGLFGIIELVRDQETYEPLAPYNGTSDEMKAIGAYLREHGLFTFLRFNMIHTNPPLIVSEAEMAEGFEIIDGALDIADKGVRA